MDMMTEDRLGFSDWEQESSTKSSHFKFSSPSSSNSFTSSTSSDSSHRSCIPRDSFPHHMRGSHPRPNTIIIKSPPPCTPPINRTEGSVRSEHLLHRHRSQSPLEGSIPIPEIRMKNRMGEQVTVNHLNYYKLNPMSPLFKAIVIVTLTMSLTVNLVESAEFWRRLGPLPTETMLGSSCKSSLQCLLFVPHAHCEWNSRTCQCQSYHVSYNETSCLPASLLGYACAVDEQCTLKVPNSKCQDGVCQCQDSFMSYRKDKCLPAAKLDNYCLNDRQCTMSSKYTYCKYIIPRIYGKCRCPVGFSTKNGKCLPALGKRCEADRDCDEATTNSYCKLPTYRSWGKGAECSCKPGFKLTPNKLSCEEVIRPSGSISITTISPPPESKTEPPTTSTTTRAPTSAPTTTTTTTTTTKPTKVPVTTLNLITTTTIPDVTLPPVNMSEAMKDVAPISLGKKCNTSIECQVRDAYSVCRNGYCDCSTPSPRCSARNTGCHSDTFQCRSGQCISWYFVCDKNRNCDDGSDEENCYNGGCPKEAFTCDDGTCLPRSSVCNGRWECPDGSDEARCYKNIACDPKSFRCKSGQCLPQYTFCNAVTDCVDGSDEIEQTCEHSRVCPKGTFQCGNGRCRSTAILCSGVDGCGDNSDEDRCEVCFCEKPMNMRNRFF